VLVELDWMYDEHVAGDPYPYEQTFIISRHNESPAHAAASSQHEVAAHDAQAPRSEN